MKKIISLRLVLAMALTLVACGGKTEAPAETGKTEVTVIAAEYGGNNRDWWTGFEEKFEAANADIDLVVEVVAWSDINVVVDTRNANGQSPDLLNIDAHAKYLEEGLLLPTSEWVSEETFAKFYPAMEGWDEVKFGVIDAQQQMLVGADIQTVLDDLQAELVGQSNRINLIKA